jgi:subtilisin
VAGASYGWGDGTMRQVTSLVAVGTLVLALLSGAASAGDVEAAAGPVDAAPGAPVVAGSYLVVLDDSRPDAVAQEHARRHGAEVERIYRFALQGYAARMSDRAAVAIARDPRVVRVEPETLESIQAQGLPSGVDRIEADLNPTITTDGTGTKAVGIPIAIIDTGIAAHADLNVAGRVDCTVASGGSPFNRKYSCVAGGGDDNGHGTHVAGTVAAKDNGIGVVGVAPGAPLWAVKVCPTGSCPSGAIIAGIDWVAGQKQTANGGSADGIDFAAVNFSISSADSDNSCTKPANTTHEAICGLVNEGVVFAMAAGNDGREKTPYPIALSVSAIADFDGLGGGAGSPTCRTDEDDTLANFSNYGPKVRIAAPGVCIRSTWNDGSYHTISGTSMATPHVTGAVALYLHANKAKPATTATDVRAIENAITGAALPQGTSKHACSYDDTKSGGPLLFTNADTFGGGGTCDVAGGQPPPPEPDPATFALKLTDASKTTGPWWRPAVSAKVTDADAGTPVAGAMVTADWSGALNGSGNCTTVTDGSCLLELGRTQSSGTIEVSIETVGRATTWEGDQKLSLIR